MRCIFLLGLVAAVSAPSQITPPLLGYLVDSQQLLPLYGVRGNFLLGDPVFSGVLASAFSDRLGVLQTASEGIVLDRDGRVLYRWESPAGGLLLAASNDGIAWTFDPATRELTRWRQGSFTRMPLSEIPGDAVALGPGWLVVAHDLKLWRWNPDTLEQTALDGVSLPLLILPTGNLVFSREGQLVVRDPAGLETTSPLPAEPRDLAGISAKWLVLRTADPGVRYLWSAGEWFMLPGVPDRLGSDP